MPTLRKYAPSSSKSGYYLHAGVGGSHPITLQVSRVAEQIFTYLGYGDEHPISGELVWPMYKAGLLWTGNSNVIPSETPLEDLIDNDAAEESFPAEKYQSLLSFLTDYDGPEQHRIRQLKDLLDGMSIFEGGSSSNHSKNTGTSSLPNHPVTRIPRPDPPVNTAGAHAVAEAWGKDTSTVSQIKELLEENLDGVRVSLADAYRHPYLTLPIEANKKGYLTYNLSLPELTGSCQLHDYRVSGGTIKQKNGKPIDFEVVVSPRKKTTTRALVRGPNIVGVNQDDRKLKGPVGERLKSVPRYVQEAIDQAVLELPKYTRVPMPVVKRAGQPPYPDPLEAPKGEFIIGTVTRISNSGIRL